LSTQAGLTKPRLNFYTDQDGKNSIMTHEEKTDRYQAMAEECMKAGRYGEAVIFYRKLIELNPGEDSFLVGLAWATRQRQIDLAVDCFEKVFEKELQRKIFTGFAFDELVRILRNEKISTVSFISVNVSSRPIRKMSPSSVTWARLI